MKMLKHFSTLFCLNFVIDFIVEANKLRCPPGWQRFMSSCYQLSAEANTWMYAKQNCESKGAQLMMLNDETEQVLLYLLKYAEVKTNFVFLLGSVDLYFLEYSSFWRKFPHSKLNSDSEYLWLIFLCYINIITWFSIYDSSQQRPFLGGVLKIWIGLYGKIKNNTLIWYLRGVDGRLLRSG